PLRAVVLRAGVLRGGALRAAILPLGETAGQPGVDREDAERAALVKRPRTAHLLEVIPPPDGGVGWSWCPSDRYQGQQQTQRPFPHRQPLIITDASRD